MVAPEEHGFGVYLDEMSIIPFFSNRITCYFESWMCTFKYQIFKKRSNESRRFPVVAMYQFTCVFVGISEIMASLVRPPHHINLVFGKVFPEGENLVSVLSFSCYFCTFSYDLMQIWVGKQERPFPGPLAGEHHPPELANFSFHKVPSDPNHLQMLHVELSCPDFHNYSHKAR